MKKVLIVLALFCLSEFLAAPSVYGADFYVECGNGCKKFGSDPLFSDSELWYPGRTATKTFSLKNVGSSTKEMVIGVTSSWGDRELEKVMTVEIVKNSGGEVVWSEDSLEKFYTQGKISMGSFNPNDEVEFAIKVAMLPDAGNDYQNKKSYFDWKLGFWEESVSPTPTPTGSVQGAKTAKVVDWYDGQGGPEEMLGGGISTSAGEVAGAQMKVCPFWWIALLVQSLFVAGLFFIIPRWGRKNLWWPVALFSVGLAFFLDRYAHTHWFVPSGFCRFELLFGLGIAWLTRPLYQEKKKKAIRS